MKKIKRVVFLSTTCLILLYNINTFLRSKGAFLLWNGRTNGRQKPTIFKRIDTRPEQTNKLPFLSKYKCPCWYEAAPESGRKLRCLPYFYVIGVPKCGTTDLCNRIMLHPLISDKVPKGNHWFTIYRYGRFAALSNYLQLFDYAVETDIKRKRMQNGYHNAIFGDCTPSLSWNRRLMFIQAREKNLTEEPFSNADLIKHLTPHSKIIAILRNPVESSCDRRTTVRSLEDFFSEPLTWPEYLGLDNIIYRKILWKHRMQPSKNNSRLGLIESVHERLYSEYLFFNEKNSNPREFHKRVLNSVNNMTMCLQKYSLRTCVYYDGERTTAYRKVDKVRLQVGIYHVFLEDFLKAFRRKQMLVIKLEKYSNQINETMQTVFSFLGVGNVTDPVLYKNITTISRANARSGDDKLIGDMLPATRQLLTEFYKPHNDRLKALLGKEFDYNQNDVS